MAKRKKKSIVLKIFLLGFAALLAGAAYLFISGPDASSHVNQLISAEIGRKPVNLLKGRSAVAKNGDVNIWYEVFTPQGQVNGSILLVMGIGSDSLVWPDSFILKLRQAGYQVIRFDHRGVGLSDWIKDWRYTQAYSLREMADDGKAVLDDLGIKKAHVVGVSMGGMIAQTMAVHYPKRIQSLTSIMSSGFLLDPELPSVSKMFFLDIVKILFHYGVRRTETDILKMQVLGRKLLRGADLSDSEIKEMAAKTLFKLRERNGYNYMAGVQHYVAMVRSGDRYDGLRRISTPTLIIHGKADPLVPFEHGRKCAKMIPNAETLWIEGLGHDLPEAYNPLMIEAIIGHIKNAVS